MLGGYHCLSLQLSCHTSASPKSPVSGVNRCCRPHRLLSASSNNGGVSTMHADSSKPLVTEEDISFSSVCSQIWLIEGKRWWEGE
jgi:hypothetical protein